MPATSAQDPRDQHVDAPVPPATNTAPATPAVPTEPAVPSVRQLLAACAAARTVSTPPDDRDAA